MDVDPALGDRVAQLVGVDVGLRGRIDVDGVVAQRLRRLVEGVLGGGRRRGGEQQDEAHEKRAHYPVNSLRSRSRSSVSFFSSRGWMTGTSIRADKPLGLASIACVSRVPAPAASSA